jgi:hypothetical protein
MHTVKFMFVMLMCTMFLGCMSQQAHERAIEELKMTSQNSVQEAPHSFRKPTKTWKPPSKN